MFKKILKIFLIFIVIVILSYLIVTEKTLFNRGYNPEDLFNENKTFINESSAIIFYEDDFYFYYKENEFLIHDYNFKDNSIIFNLFIDEKEKEVRLYILDVNRIYCSLDKDVYVLENTL